MYSSTIFGEDKDPPDWTRDPLGSIPSFDTTPARPHSKNCVPHVQWASHPPPPPPPPRKIWASFWTRGCLGYVFTLLQRVRIQKVEIIWDLSKFCVMVRSFQIFANFEQAFWIVVNFWTGRHLRDAHFPTFDIFGVKKVLQTVDFWWKNSDFC